jgi:sporulation protein YlmC with PRC-barrel domain
MSGRRLDLHLQLLDRQVVDQDGKLVCKVDDLELEVDEGGQPYVTAILAGPRALGPRLGGRLGRWVTGIATRLADDRDSGPQRISFALVEEVGSAIRLGVRRQDLQVEPLERWVDEHIIGRIPGSRMRASDLLGRRVVDRGGQHLGVVVDLRCEQDGPLQNLHAAFRVHALVVSRHVTGSLLGYDRGGQRGPWLVATLARRLHRNSVLVPWSAIAEGTEPIQLQVDAAQLARDTT